MPEPNNTNPYEEYQQQVQAIELANEPTLDGFKHWLQQSTLGQKTISGHVSNIHFFSVYLVSDDELPRRLDQATSGDVYMFLDDWFPRKALWCSVRSMKGHIVSFKKFFKWMGEAGLVSPEIVADVLETLKSERDELLRGAEE